MFFFLSVSILDLFSRILSNSTQIKNGIESRWLSKSSSLTVSICVLCYLPISKIRFLIIDIQEISMHVISEFTDLIAMTLMGIVTYCHLSKSVVVIWSHHIFFFVLLCVRIFKTSFIYPNKKWNVPAVRQTATKTKKNIHLATSFQQNGLT